MSLLKTRERIEGGDDKEVMRRGSRGSGRLEGGDAPASTGRSRLPRGATSKLNSWLEVTLWEGKVRGVMGGEVTLWEGNVR